LLNGKVLITGGSDARNGGMASAELYDPVTGTFSATGSMSVGRRMHSATLLPDGRVLVLGGYDVGVPLGEAELYDPETGTFSTAGRLVRGRGGHDAILLRNGTVLIVGGGDGSYPTLPPAEVYDPAARAFTPVGPYVGSFACDFCAPSTLLADGRVLFPGQIPAQLYDPVTRTFAATGRASAFESTAALLMDGRVLYTGGEDFGRMKNAEVFDPVSGTFAATSDMAISRVWHSLTLLPDGTVLTTGGETDSCSASSCIFAGTTSSAEVYQPSTGKFASAGAMIGSREGHTATVLNDGRVLIAGGVGYGGIGVYYGSSSTAELYTPKTLIAAPDAFWASPEARAGGLVVVVVSRFPDGSVIPPQVTIGGRLADVLWFGSLPDSPSPTVVIVRVPTGLAPGPVALRVSYIGRASNALTLVAR
jgi:hypothetical protein